MSALFGDIETRRSHFGGSSPRGMPSYVAYVTRPRTVARDQTVQDSILSLKLLTVREHTAKSEQPAFWFHLSIVSKSLL